MPRCYYYGIRLRDGTPQILVSRFATITALTPDNTQVLLERRNIFDTHQPGLEWLCNQGLVSQAAIALLAHATTAPTLTCRYAQAFQDQVVSQFPPQCWIGRADQIRTWVAVQRRQERLQHSQTLISTHDSKELMGRT
jgi:hypothetical protein